VNSEWPVCGYLGSNNRYMYKLCTGQCPWGILRWGKRKQVIVNGFQAKMSCILKYYTTSLIWIHDNLPRSSFRRFHDTYIITLQSDFRPVVSIQRRTRGYITQRS
jgi:hypothetical protein